MVALPPPAQTDPTLDAVNAAMEARQRAEPKRTYLGMSSIGHLCSRKLWYDFHTERREQFDALTLRRFADGHAGEAVMADRLRMVPGVTLLTVDPDTGRQWGFEDIGGHFGGHMDGVILGLVQAPDTFHVWEHKAVNEKKQAKLASLKASLGEKSALAAWDSVYFTQATLYMDYAGLTRHYLTCSTPGERSTISVRTNADPAHAAIMRDKAKRIIEARAPLARLSNDPSWFACKWCAHHAVCHGEAA